LELGGTDKNPENEIELSAWIPMQEYTENSEYAKFIHRKHLDVNSYLCGSLRVWP
jgi:hypothetical protein